jgi:hypothetical protein
MVDLLQRELDSAWLEFFELGDRPWAEQRVAAQRVAGLRRQIASLGAVAH